MKIRTICMAIFLGIAVSTQMSAKDLEMQSQQKVSQGDQDKNVTKSSLTRIERILQDRYREVSIQERAKKYLIIIALSGGWGYLFDMLPYGTMQGISLAGTLELNYQFFCQNPQLKYAVPLWALMQFRQIMSSAF